MGQTLPPNADELKTVFGLLAHLFHDHFCQSLNIAESEKHKVAPESFAAWLDEKRSSFEWDHMVSGGAPDAVAALGSVIAEGHMGSSLRPMWWQLSLSRRPPLDHPIAAVTLNSIVHYADGRKAVLCASIRRELVAGGSFTEGVLYDATAQAATQLTGLLVNKGVSSLREASIDLRGDPLREDPFRVLIASIRRLSRDTADPVLQARLERYENLIVQVLTPDGVGPDIKSLADVRELMQDRGAVGGWSV